MDDLTLDLRDLVYLLNFKIHFQEREEILQNVYAIMWELKTHEIIENVYIMNKLKVKFISYIIKLF